jgi:hypothetical protein
VGWLGDEGPADEIFETLLRHRPPSISPDTAAFHAKQHRFSSRAQASVRTKRDVLATRDLPVSRRAKEPTPSQKRYPAGDIHGRHEDDELNAG